jgi:polysaccharide chain length determinant protein (PEP-CTERM system associated)
MAVTGQGGSDSGAIRETIASYLTIIRRRRWSVVLPTVAISAIAVPIALLWPPTYKSTTLIMVEAQKIPQEFVRTTVTTPIEDRLKTISQQILSRTRLERVIQEFGLADEYSDSGSGWFSRLWSRNQEPGEAGSAGISLDLVEKMKQNIEITVRAGNTFTVSYSGSQPEAVMNVTNKLASLFIEENLRIREAQAEGTAEFLENELATVKAKMEAQEESLRVFKERYMGELPGQLETNLRTLDRLQAERQRLQDSLRLAEDRYSALASQSVGLSAEGAEVSTPALALKLQALRNRLAELRNEYKDEYPDIVALKKEIASVEADLAAQPQRESAAASVPRVADPAAAQLADAQREIKGIKARQQAIADQITEYERRVERTPLREQQLTQVTRDSENVRRTYQALLDKRQDARIAENLERRQKGEIFRILDPANYPDKPVKPNRMGILLMGIFLGLGSGFGLAMFREHLDISIKSEEDLLGAAPDVAILTVVPLVKHHGLAKPSPTIASTKGAGKHS